MKGAGQQLAVAIEWGTRVEAVPGEAEAGDRCIVCPFASGVLLGAIDGLGHGREAAAAAGIAAEVLAERPSDPVAALLRRCHGALKRTRGAVIALASIHYPDNSLSWLGVGNVEAVLYRAAARGDGNGGATAARDTHVIQLSGVVGYQLPDLRPASTTIAVNDRLLMATDGVRSDFPREIVLRGQPQKTADLLMQRNRKTTDDALILVARYLGNRP